MKNYQLYIGGEWKAGKGESFESYNPYDEQSWATVSTASESDVGDAVNAATDAFESVWRKTSGRRRGELMFNLADQLDRHADRLCDLETKDNGKVIRETSTQMHFAARNYRYFGGYADKLTGETKPLDNTSLFDFTTREPLGVAALITAWNSPMILLAYKLAPALAAGNTIVVKPSEHTSVTTLEFAQLVQDAGFPPGVFNVVTGAAGTGHALTTDPRLGTISFTGSVAIGRLIAADAAHSIIPATLELGGKSANIIFADADLDRAIPGAIAGIFGAAGQTCIAGSRLLVQRAVYDQVVQQLAERAVRVRLGNPLDHDTEMGPVAHEAQFTKILGDIERARREGARIVAGGHRAENQPRGFFIAPTIVADVDPHASLAQEEVFGPVLAVIPFDDEHEAIAIANDTNFGLAAGIWTSDLRRAHAVARELRCGTVWVNTYRTSAAQAPAGGIKHSGYGRERGVEALLSYTTFKNTMIDLGDEARDPFALRT